MEVIIQICGGDGIRWESQVLKRLVCEALAVDDCVIEEKDLLLEIKVQSTSAQVLAVQNRVLSGMVDAVLSRELSKIARKEISAKCDRHSFATNFAEARRFAELALTAHQAEVLSSCEGKSKIHLRAPAGAGKTHWSLFLMLRALREDSSGECDSLVVLVARNAALGAWATRWLVRREEEQSEKDRLLGRLRILYVRNNCCFQRARIDKDILLFEDDNLEKNQEFGLIVVDEAHHVYANPESRSRLSTIRAKKWVLLSDESQSHGHAVQYPGGLDWTQVKLRQVARCSKRLVAGAMAFQLGGDTKLDTENCTNYDGPPLKSYVFLENSLDAYLRRLREALQHADQVLLPALGLGSRLLICVPTIQHRDTFKKIVTEALQKWNLRPISALEAVSRFNEDKDAVIYDAIDELDGLESLLVICLGLDAASDENHIAVSRSALYRGLTRAQLGAIVVNHKVKSGWLEFLNTIRLDDEKIDTKLEAKRLRPEAADERVRDDLIKQALQDTVIKRGLRPLTPLALKMLAKACLNDDSTDSIASQLDAWCHEVQLVKDRLRILDSNNYDDEEDEKIATEVALELRQGLRLDTQLNARIQERARGQALKELKKTLETLEPQSEAEAIVLGDDKVKALLTTRALANKDDSVQCQKTLLSALKAVAETYSILRQRILEREDGQEEWALDATRMVAEGATCDDALHAIVKKHKFKAEQKAASDAIHALSELDKEKCPGIKPLLIAAVIRHHSSKNDTIKSKAGLLFGLLRRRKNDYWSDLADCVLKSWLRARQHLDLIGTPEEDCALLLESVASEEDMVTDPCGAAERAVECWQNDLRQKKELKAAAGSAVEAEARRLRISLNFTVSSELVDRVLREKPALHQITDSAVRVLKNYIDALERRKLSQAVWDTQANEHCELFVDGYAPYTMDDEVGLDYDALLQIFRFLGMTEGCTTAAAVCRRWRAVANDPTWRPRILVFAWGNSGRSGLNKDYQSPRLLPWSLCHAVVSLVCANYSTLALTDNGFVYHWGRYWNSATEIDVPKPKKIDELRDVISISVTPCGYRHTRLRTPGFSACAITSYGNLYTWGDNYQCANYGHLFHMDERCIERPKRVIFYDEILKFFRERNYRVIHATLGLRFIALNIELYPKKADDVNRLVIVHGQYHVEPPMLTRVRALDNLELRQLVGGSFHCCALSKTGELFTFGHPEGFDISNGNLLGTGRPARPRLGLNPLPQFDASRVNIANGDPITHVAASTYSTVALSIDSNAYCWGDSDGNALGDHVPTNDDENQDLFQQSHRGDTPLIVSGLRGIPAIHADVCYTNGAITTIDGRVFLWGGLMWEGGLASNRSDVGPTELKWHGIPPGYQASAISLGHEHGYLLLSST